MTDCALCEGSSSALATAVFPVCGTVPGSEKDSISIYQMIVFPSKQHLCSQHPNSAVSRISGGMRAGGSLYALPPHPPDSLQSLNLGLLLILFDSKARRPGSVCPWQGDLVERQQALVTGWFQL